MLLVSGPEVNAEPAVPPLSSRDDHDTTGVRTPVYHVKPYAQERNHEEIFAEAAAATEAVSDVWSWRERWGRNEILQWGYTRFPLWGIDIKPGFRKLTDDPLIRLPSLCQLEVLDEERVDEL
ncbi:hypothetical protein HK104_005106 [Borealophlyctis nickersoniae]|nr:hypothetical protein HK104_005106 [Borealophlyctis nickersoniae]